VAHAQQRFSDRIAQALKSGIPQVRAPAVGGSGANGRAAALPSHDPHESTGVGALTTDDPHDFTEVAVKRGGEATTLVELRGS